MLVDVYETELSDIDFLKETTEILDVVFKKTHRSVLSSLKTRDEAKSF